jgi:uncharacterized protein YidB (DUF937 family)
MLGDLLNNLKSNLSQFGVDEDMLAAGQKIAGMMDFSNIGQVKDSLMGAINQAASDGKFTLDDLQSISGLQSMLGIDENEMGSIKTTVLEQVINRVTKDGVVTPMEKQVVDFIAGQMSDRLTPELQSGLAKVNQLYQG